MNTFGEFADNIAAQLVGSPAKYLSIDQVPVDEITK